MDSLGHTLIDIEIDTCNLRTENCVCKYQLMYCMYLYRIRVISVLHVSKTDIKPSVVIIPLQCGQYEG